ncbi:ROK family protein [Alkaliphilus metalliredigens QYMF]|uniref:ROK family protein n=1 Tax=Alkaliphilus metalliredigens (strain QYMF) TaxID=293826 RepID=A6TUP6_ALKMQ|nr:ROK family transcriptional regulator [Alkaliphilus metalliredigens]ABR49914.1 ROK family protein [Alkaliphilus metalliredigens QYMF]
MINLETFSQDQIKEINRSNIINMIKQKYEITKHEIAVALKLSIPTITTNINQLIEEGLVEEAGVGNSTGGRKPMILKLVENARFSVGVDVSPDKVRILLIDLNNTIIDEASFDYVKDLSFKGVLDEVKTEIERFMTQNNISKNKILGVGISLPGLVDEDRLILENAPNIGVRDFNFQEFQDSLQLRVFIENEANIAAYAEKEIGKTVNMRNVVYVSITEGVGTGIIVNQHIYKSSNKKAGEFGHMRISDEPRPCNCGRTGCWELYASKKALSRYYEESTGLKVSTLDEIFSEESFNMPSVKEAIGRYIDCLFIGIENIILGLNPEFVIIGGELGKYEKEMLTLINGRNNMKSSFVEYEGTKVVFSALKDKGSLIGAALLPLEDLFNYTKNII